MIHAKIITTKYYFSNALPQQRIQKRIQRDEHYDNKKIPP